MCIHFVHTIQTTYELSLENDKISVIHEIYFLIFFSIFRKAVLFHMQSLFHQIKKKKFNFSALDVIKIHGTQTHLQNVDYYDINIFDKVKDGFLMHHFNMTRGLLNV